MNRLALVLLLTAACSHAEVAQRAPDPLPATEPTPKSVSKRILDMSDDGWVVSRDAAGAAVNVGDSLIFTGLFLGLADCEDGAAPERALLHMLGETHGVPYRHPSLRGQGYTLDGLLGLWWGIYARVRACPESRSAWAAMLPEHALAVRDSYLPQFEVVLDTLLAELGLAEAPNANRRGELGSVVAGWAAAVVAHKEAGYRLHLGFLALSMVDAPEGKKWYCAAVNDAQMPLLEDFCGREGLKEWFQGFQFDVWEYQHQRAVWESPDAHGYSTPGLDWLMAASRFGS